MRPGAYRFEARVRASGITTDQGAGPDERAGGTTDWKRVEKRFVAPKQTRVVEAQVIREASQKFGNKIRGAVSIDAVRLEELNH